GSVPGGELAREQAQGRLRVDDLATHWVDIGGVKNERACHQFVERELPGSSWAGRSVVGGKAPSGIEGRAPGVHRYATQQGFEARQRAHGVQFVDLAKQRGDAERGDLLVVDRAGGAVDLADT